MQISVPNTIESYLAIKYRASKSFSTKNSYKNALKKLSYFLQIKSLDVYQLVNLIKLKKIDAIDTLDEFYSFLSNDPKQLSNATIRMYLIVGKDFLNYNGCKIYNEDVKQRFKLPKRIQNYEKGLTKEIINRVIRFSNAKIATAILLICSSGMRIAELIQLRMEDIDFDANPVTLTLRAETTKSRQTRITCISAEALNSLKDYIAKHKITSGHIFLKTHNQKIAGINHKLQKNDYQGPAFKLKGQRRLSVLLKELETLSPDEIYSKSVRTMELSMQHQLAKIVKDIPGLNNKNENGRSQIHFHGFRAWFKTQVTDAHQSDFAEALMGHQSLKLIYYRQNDKARANTYKEVEHALTLSDTEKIDDNYSDLQKDNQELRGIVDSLSRQLQNLERRIVTE